MTGTQTQKNLRVVPQFWKTLAVPAKKANADLKLNAQMSVDVWAHLTQGVAARAASRGAAGRPWWGDVVSSAGGETKKPQARNPSRGGPQIRGVRRAAQ